MYNTLKKCSLGKEMHTISFAYEKYIIFVLENTSKKLKQPLFKND